jgi:glycosyltransferase involved in cell wall biosynthesis
VVDDGSTDNTKDILDGIKDNRLKYITQQNSGAAAARNKAYGVSSGEYIKFMDADDLVNTACIETQLSKIISNPNCIASAKWGRFYTEDGSDFKVAPEKIYKDLPGIDWLINSLIDTGANMMQPGIFLIPRNLVELSGSWNESLNLIDDFEYMVRVISHSSHVLFCEDAILMYRSGLTNSLSRRVTERNMESAFHSLNLGIERILQVKNDSQSRKACANTLRRWSYNFYPDHKELYKKMEAAIAELGGANVPVMGGRIFTLLSAVIGWQKAKKLKIYLTGNS